MRRAWRSASASCGSRDCSWEDKEDGEDDDSLITSSFYCSARCPEKKLDSLGADQWKQNLSLLRGRLAKDLLELLRGLVQQRLWISARIGQDRLHDRVKRSVHLLRLVVGFRAQGKRRVNKRCIVLQRDRGIFLIQGRDLLLEIALEQYSGCGRYICTT